MLSSIIALPVFAILASTAPSKSSQPKGQYIDANYDDITVVPAVPAANTLTTYRGLNYTGWAVNQVGVGGQAELTGIAPESKPNNIVSGFGQTSLTGANAGWSVASSASTFDQLAFYYGCSVNTVEGAEGLPQQCIFDVKGYRKASDASYVAIKQFSFNPKATQLVAQPVLATFDSSFANLQRVEIVQLESTSGEEGNVLVFDDNIYELYATQKW
ncbi:Hypothetical predicted protein [Lecanosticta acicola]|uniref:Uncharacterized protein n=1 Tax=Lecanosticta acicola TaxID=111012 RepID=A0AAI8YYS6_9PEZI|nr:Hypothetical predicted protein [Lecanosticta acicola]